MVIFTTGGTIDKVYFDAKGGYEVGAPMVREILNQARVLEPVPVIEVLRKDSLEITDADRATLRAAVAATDDPHVVITHGTDTMVETALVLQDLGDRTIVLTGALQPGRFTDSDAPFNLGMAIAAAQTLKAGVWLAANGHIFAAGRVRKNRELNRFEQIEPEA